MTFRSSGIPAALGVAAGVLLVDVLTKAWVMANLGQGERIPVIPGWLNLTYVRNPGAAYGLLAGQVWLLAAIAGAAVVVALVYAHTGDAPWQRWGMGLLIGGALGNLIDRLRWGLVTDFLEIQPLPIFRVFNVADMAISGAVVLIIWGSWRHER